LKSTLKLPLHNIKKIDISSHIRDNYEIPLCSCYQIGINTGLGEILAPSKKMNEGIFFLHRKITILKILICSIFTS